MLKIGPKPLRSRNNRDASLFILKELSLIGPVTIPTESGDFELPNTWMVVDGCEEDSSGGGTIEELITRLERDGIKNAKPIQNKELSRKAGEPGGQEQPGGIKALAAAALERNQMRNKPATNNNYPPDDESITEEVVYEIFREIEPYLLAAIRKHVK